MKRASIKIVVLVIVSAACVNLLDQGHFFTPLRGRWRLRELQQMAAHLPAVTGTVVVAQEAGIALSRVFGCQVAYMAWLYGTNELSPAEVVAVYRRQLDTSVWQPQTEAHHGLFWQNGQQMYLGVGPYQDWPLFDITREEQKKRYQTLFLVELTAFVYADYSPERCT